MNLTIGGIYKLIENLTSRVIRRVQKNFILLFILLIAIAILLNLVLPSIFYGFRLVTGPDELDLFNRGKSIASGNSDIFHLWGDPNYLDTYPPGFSILIGEILNMVPGIDVFATSVIVRAILMVLSLSLYFWLGLFFSRSIALLSMLFRISLFTVYTSYPSLYVYIFSDSALYMSSIFSEIAILLIIIFSLRYFKRIGSDRSNLSLIFIAGLLHGFTHITGFVSFTIFIIIFLGFLQLYISHNSLVFSTDLKAKISSFLRSRIMKPAYVCMTLPLIIFLLYYLKIFMSATDNIYYLDRLFPLPMSETQYITIIVSAFLVGVFGIWLKESIPSSEQIISNIGRNTRTSHLLLITYVAGFLLTVIIVNIYPSQFNYLTYAITTGFASVLPTTFMNSVTILSFIAGIFLFILSLIGIYSIGMNRDFQSRYIWLFYLFSYMYFILLFFFGIIAPHRSLFFLILLPLLLATVIVKFNRTLARMIGGKKTFFLAVRKTLRPVPIIIIAGFLIIAVVSRSNIDPSIRENINSGVFLEFGHTIPPVVTSQFLDKVKEFYTPGSAILSSPDTQSALYSILDIKPMSPDYTSYVINNNQWRTVVSALFYIQSGNPVNWLLAYNGTLLVVGYSDSHIGPQQYGYIPLPIQKYDADPGLEKIYSDEFGEIIYRLNATMYPTTNSISTYSSTDPYS